MVIVTLMVVAFMIVTGMVFVFGECAGAFGGGENLRFGGGCFRGSGFE